MEEYILKMEGITKEFPGVKALDNVDFFLKRGEIHALIGENGAGKSTLVKVLTGINTPDAGTITFKGKPFQPNNPKHAMDNGISMIYQEFNLIPHLTVAENIFVAREPRKGNSFLINDQEMIVKTQELMDRLNLDISPTALVKNLSVAEKQMVEIAKALLEHSDILILDEPTSALAEHEVQKLFEILLKLKNEVSIIYISHRLEEFEKIIDRVTVMRDGKYIGTYEWKDITIQQLITKMVGRSITEQYPRHIAKIGEVVLEAKNITNKKLKNVSLSVRKGEILGLAGMMGAGRTELARAIFAADPIQSGEIFLNGERVSFKSPADAIKNKIAYLPEDRKKDGLMLGLGVDENILAACRYIYGNGIFVNQQRYNEVVDERIQELSIKTPSAKQKVRLLSGGNQQKVLVARWLCRDSELVIFDEPTRGIDVGAKHEIYQIINNIADSGAAVILISSDMPEVIGLSDRIAVMFEGALVGEIDGKTATQEKVLNLASNILN